MNIPTEPIGSIPRPLAFVRAVRALPDDSSTTPVIALTAFGRPEDRELAITAGFSEYLKKPVEPEELASLVLRLARQNGAPALLIAGGKHRPQASAPFGFAL